MFLSTSSHGSKVWIGTTAEGGGVNIPLTLGPDWLLLLNKKLSPFALMLGLMHCIAMIVTVQSEWMN